jgi:hypothetical protein
MLHDRKVVKTKTAEHKHPVAYQVSKLIGPVLLWSSRNDRGHFGISKLIWGDSAATGFYVDAEGKYGLTQFAYAIVDTPENLPLIKKALESNELKEIMKACSVGQEGMNHKIIATFRKDFWKDFV